MASDKQNSANKQNSAKSTGPKSQAGKTAAAVNAMSHGLTTAPDAELVRKWYRILVEDDTAEPDPNTTDPYLKAAYALAHAEAVLARLQEAYESHLKFILTCLAKEGQSTLLEIDATDLDDPDVLKVLIKNDVKARKILKCFLKLSPQLPANYLKREQLMMRYRREAHSKQRRAYQVWLREQHLRAA